MPNTNRQMTMVAFLQAQNCSNLPGSWRHPASMSDFLTPDYYQRIARILEDGKFHMAFFDDRLAMPDIYGGNPAEVIATTDYGGPTVAIVAAGNRVGTQFHVEKSQEVGIRILMNFLRWTP